jgi:hypothetical protein
MNFLIQCTEQSNFTVPDCTQHHILQLHNSLGQLNQPTTQLSSRKADVRLCSAVLALSTVNSHMPCASTEGQKVMKDAGKYEYLCSTKNLLGKKITPLFLHKLQSIHQG